MPRSLTLAIVLTVLAPGEASLAQGGPPPGGVRCDYTQKIECTSEGCQPAPPGGGYLLLQGASALVVPFFFFRHRVPPLLEIRPALVAMHWRIDALQQS